MIKKSAVSVMVLCAVSGVARASNIDVTNFFTRAKTAIATPSDQNARTEAVNAYDNLNASHEKIEGLKKILANRDRTSSQVSALNTAHVERFKQLKAEAEEGTAHAQDNRNRTAMQHVDGNTAVATVNATAQSALLTAHSSSNEASLVNSKAATIHKEVMDNEVRDDSQDRAIHHAQTNADAALNGNLKQSQYIADNKEAIKGLQLEQANRDRTAFQHATPQPKNGKDGVTTVIAKNDTRTQQQVSRNSDSIQLMRGQVISESRARYDGDVAAVKSANGYTDQRIKSVEDQQSNDRKEYRAGIAGAISISGLHYVDTDNSVAVGAGSFKDAQGYALGYRHKFSENVAATVAASETSKGDTAFSASAAIGW
ncbi:YadA-like family protein [unidentified bacterial endosymbiont]|uniref:YadA-like family protein n=1 Tax=unidentified bacterial endosymbiont TaxID=2355 RepID=UPI00209D302B|nr:YadA-like family protein [unidentified bacterial endosymbiont]